MPPEQLRGQVADARSDVWSLGVVLYEMAAGRRPFEGKSGFDISSAILKEAPPPLPSSVPGELGAVIARCLAKEPAGRYQQAGELRTALEAIGTGKLAPWAGWRYELSRRRMLVYAGGTATVLAGLVIGLRGRMWGPSRSVRLAVLPFANLSGDPEQEYLSDGMTQEMISQLGSLHPASLSVIGRTSVMRYKKSDKPVDEVARELNVDFILEGSARREGKRIRITAELIQAGSQTQLWSETYEREIAGVLALQSEVSKRVATSLALRLLPAEQARIAKVRQVNPEAYEAYSKGLQQWYRLTQAGVDSALQYFQTALQKDPSYAPAYAGVSLVWVGRAQTSLVSRAEALPQLMAAALKAVELDDNIAETHYSLAVAKAWYEWDWTAAEREFRRAIEINPSFPDARAYYSLFLICVMQRPKEGLEQMSQVLELDPFNALFQALYGRGLTMLRRYDEAIAQARRALQLVPDHPVALTVLRDSFGLKGMQQQEVAQLKANRTFRGDHEAVAAFDQGYQEGGNRGGWKRYAEYRAKAFRKTGVGAWGIAQAYCRAGEKSLALDWLEKGFEVRDPSLPHIADPTLDPVRSEPRFQALRRKMNLPA